MKLKLRHKKSEKIKGNLKIPQVDTLSGDVEQSQTACTVDRERHNGMILL
jgi:hypothetical protein